MESTAVITGGEQTSSSLLLSKLPPEIRNRIWRLILYSGDLPAVIDLPQAYQGTALLRTCRQIPEETTSIFYGENTFSCLAVLGSAEILLAEIQLLTTEQARHLRDLLVHFSYVDCVARHPTPLSVRRGNVGSEQYETISFGEAAIFCEAVRVAQALVLGGVRLTAVRAGAVQVIDSDSLGSSLDYDKELFAYDVRSEFEKVLERVRDQESLVWRVEV